MSQLKQKTIEPVAHTYHIEKTSFLNSKERGQLPPFKSLNDTLYEDLEARYGSGFAQWIIDGLNKGK